MGLTSTAKNDGLQIVKAHELEAKARETIDRVIANQPTEDMIYELKSEWPSPPSDAARLLAGSANAARGEPVLWIIGVHEKRREITGVNELEVSSWYDQIVKEYDDKAAPRLDMNVNIRYDHKTVVAMLFDTQNPPPPYVVNNPNKGQPGGDDRRILREVPWREGNSVRTARRHELLKILTASELTPDCELVGCTLDHGSDQRGDRMNLTVTVYVVPKSERQIVLPFRRCKAHVKMESAQEPLEFQVTVLSQGYEEPYMRGPSATIFNSQSELIVRGPGTMAAYAERSGRATAQSRSDIDFILKMGAVHTARDIVLSGTMSPCISTNGLPRWELRK